MPFELLDNLEPVMPSDADVRLAQDAMALLSRLVQKGESLRLRPERQANELVELPAPAAELLLRLVTDLAAGHAIALVPIHLELTTQQAAEMLGVSRPFIVKQIDEGRLPHRKVGTHRRILLRDLLEYKRRMDASRRRALDELAADGQDLGIGY